MYRIRKQLKWEGAHRLVTSYTEACQRIHGHSYRADVIIEAKELDEDGMVVDFKKIKDAIAGVIDLLDHRTMLHVDDRSLFADVNNEIVQDSIIWVDFNPTAENMCQYILQFLIIHLDCSKFHSVAIRIHETCTGDAELKEILDA